MSEGIRRKGASKKNQMKKEKGSKDIEEKRNFIVTVLLGIVSLIWCLVRIVMGSVLLLYVASVILMYSSPAARHLMIYLHPLKNPFQNLSDPSSFGLHSTVNFYIPGPAGRLGAWDTPAHHVSQKEDSLAEEHFHLKDGSPIILYFHGNAYTRGGSHRVGLYKLLSSLGYHVIAIDYRGYGDSEGRPSEQGLIEDGIAAWKWIKSKSVGARVYIWGHSLGSGVAGGVGKALCAEGSPPSGIVLEAPFNNVWEGAARHPMTIPFRFLPYFNETVLDEVKEVFRTDKRLADVSCSILILHDREDEIISFDLGKKLYEVAKDSRPPKADPIKFVELNGHHGHKMIFQSDKLPGILRDFIKTK